MVKSIKNRKNTLFIWAIVAVCISSGCLLVILYINSITLEKYDLYARLSIGGVTGLDVNSTALIFGRIIYGSNSEKKMILENTYNFPVVYSFEIEGNISDFLIFDREVHLGAGENKTISISTITFSDEEYGDYEGFLKVVVKKDVWD